MTTLDETSSFVLQLFHQTREMNLEPYNFLKNFTYRLSQTHQITKGLAKQVSGTSNRAFSRLFQGQSYLSAYSLSNFFNKEHTV